MPEMTVAVARIDQLPEVLALLAEGGREMKARGEPQAWPDPFPAADVAPYIDLQCVYLASVAPHGTVGTFMLVDEDPAYWGARSHPSSHLHRMAVKREFAGQGFGRQILDWVTTRLTAQQIRILRLECLRSAARLRAYYESLGFRTVGDSEAHGLELTLYERHLG
jgi:GNAT superfamily N-acetyltransferase